MRKVPCLLIWIGLFILPLLEHRVLAAEKSPSTKTLDQVFYFKPLKQTRWLWRNVSPDVSRMLRERRFDSLEKIAWYWRTKKIRDRDGFWRLRTLYQTVSAPRIESRRNWRILFDYLEEWKQKNPGSITARLAIAHAWTRYSWFARGPGMNANVSIEGRELMRERLRKANSVLKDATSLSEKCPDYYAVVHNIAMGQGWPRSSYEEIFQIALTLADDYDDYYLSYAYYLLPRWYGKQGDSMRFAFKITNGGKKNARAELYARMVWHIFNYDPGIVSRGEVNWEYAREGFREIIRKYPSRWNLNSFCYIAFFMRDRASVSMLIDKIGDDFEPAIWFNEKSYRKVRDWVKIEI